MVWGIGDKLRSAYNGISGAISSVGNGIKQGLTGAIDTGKNIAHKIVEKGTGIAQKGAELAKTVGGAVVKGAKATANFVVDHADTIGGITGAVAGAVGSGGFNPVGAIAGWKTGHALGSAVKSTRRGDLAAAGEALKSTKGAFGGAIDNAMKLTRKGLKVAQAYKGGGRAAVSAVKRMIAPKAPKVVNRSEPVYSKPAAVVSNGPVHGRDVSF
jgi:hypothetical protein